MKGFHFRLEPVLTLRRHREETLQVQLAESLRTLDLESDRLEAIKREITEQSLRFGRHQNRGTLDLGLLTREADYQRALERRLLQQTAVVGELTRRVEEDREAVIRAAREKKALERLRDSQMVAFVREEARKQQNVAEELATARYVRSQQGLGEI